MAYCWRWLTDGDGSLLEMWWFNDGHVVVELWWLIQEMWWLIVKVADHYWRGDGLFLEMWCHIYEDTGMVVQ